MSAAIFFLAPKKIVPIADRRVVVVVVTTRARLGFDDDEIGMTREIAFT